jgi:transposase
MVWGCLCFNGVGTLCRVQGNINSEKYIDILDTNLWPVIVRHFPNGSYLFQDDNAPVHRSRRTQEFIARNRIKGMSWPAQSPDLNIIENVWLYIKRKLQSQLHNINSADELFQHTLRIWQDINLHYVRNLYNSVPRRIQQVIRLKGHLTKY